jgi:glycerophosphoryl diester phosphodiesterase
VTFSPGVAPPQPVARRAASHQAPENTRATISKALTLGIDVIELDGRLSRDGIPVLSHDATLDRTASAAGPATALTAAELANLDAGSWHHPGFADESVPTLAEAFNLIDGAAHVNIDVKANAAAPPVIDVIRRSRVEDGVIISGRTAPRAGEVRRLAPDVHLLLNHRPSSPATDGEPPHSPDGSIAAALRLGAVGVNLDHRHVTDEFRLAAHDAGLQVWAYTVDNQPGYQALIACGVDFITSNWPDEMLPLLNGRRQSHPIQ